MARPSLPDPIERAARPFLPKLLQVAAENGDFPGDYFLILGKYDAKESVIVPRALAGEILAQAKTEARRRKYERLIGSPCDKHDLLVMVCAGDHVEGHWMKVPALVPATGTVCEEMTPEQMPADVQRYMRIHLGAILRAIRAKSPRPGDWVVILRVPDEVPVILRRSAAKGSLAKAGAGDELLRELAKPAADHEVFCVHPAAGKLFWFRARSAVVVETGEAIETFAQRMLHDCSAQLRDVGQDPNDYLAYVKWPPAEDGGVEHIVCPRVKVEEELGAIRGSAKYEQIVTMIADPFDGLMVFVDAAERENIVWAVDDAGFRAEVGDLLGEAMKRLGLDSPPEGGG